MEYEFFVSKKLCIRLSNAPRSPDTSLISIAHSMEMNGLYYGRKIRIHAIGIRSDYLPPIAPLRMLHLKNQDVRG